MALAFLENEPLAKYTSWRIGGPARYFASVPTSEALIAALGWAHERGLPVLVGTVSVEISETLSRMLKRGGFKHEVLNAKYHQREAEIVAQAGHKHAVTVATNMAGRGVDVILGGNAEGLAAREAAGSPEFLPRRGRPGQKGERG